MNQSCLDCSTELKTEWKFCPMCSVQLSNETPLTAPLNQEEKIIERKRQGKSKRRFESLCCHYCGNSDTWEKAELTIHDEIFFCNGCECGINCFGMHLGDHPSCNSCGDSDDVIDCSEDGDECWYYCDSCEISIESGCRLEDEDCSCPTTKRGNRKAAGKGRKLSHHFDDYN